MLSKIKFSVGRTVFLLLAMCSLTISNSVNGQSGQDLQVYPLDAESLPTYVEDTLFGDGGELKFISYQGGWDGVGAFKYGEDIGISRGLILSNGWIEGAEGRNTTGAAVNERDDLGGNYDDDLNKLLTLIGGGGAHDPPDTAVDASVLLIEFMPYYQNIKMSFVFASEEYKYHNLPARIDVNMADSVQSDVLGIFMWLQPTNKTMINLLGEAQKPIGVKYINHNSPTWFRNWYIPNEESIVHPQGLSTQYDGLTKIRDVVVSELVPCQRYKIKFAIGDNPILMKNPNTGQPIGPYINSAVFLQEKSLVSGDGYSWGLEWDFQGASDNPDFEPNEIVEGGCASMVLNLTKTVELKEDDTLFIGFKMANGTAGEFEINPPPYNDSVFAMTWACLDTTYVITALDDGNSEGAYEDWTFKYMINPCDKESGGPFGTFGFSGEIPIRVYERHPIVNANKNLGPIPSDIYFCGNDVTININDILEGGVPPYTQLWQSTLASGFGPEFTVPIAASPEIVVCTVKDRCSEIDGYNTAMDTVFIYSTLSVTQETPDFQLCENLEQPIQIINTNVGPDVSVKWYFQGNLIGSTNPHIITWDDYEMYYEVLDSLVFTYIVSDDCGNHTNGSVVAFWDPIVQIQGPQVICLEEEITLFCSEGQSYQWFQNSVSTGNEIPGAISSSYSFTPTVAGMQTICVEIINSCDQPASTCYNFEVSQLICAIELNSSEELQTCPNEDFQLSEINAFAEWQWSWTDEGMPYSATGQSISLSLLEPGLHVVQVSAYNQHGCFDERSFDVTVFPYTELEIACAFDSVCINTPTQINAISVVDAINWSWTASPPDPSLTGQENLQSPTVSPDVPTLYTCNVIDENGCSDESVFNLYIRPAIVGALVSNPESVCSNEQVLIDFMGNAAAGASYNWAFEDGSPATSSTKQTNVLWQNAGTYNVTLDISEPGCEQSMDLSVLVNPKPLPAATASVSSGCQPLEVSFDNNSTDLQSPTYNWDFGDGFSSGEAEPVHVFDSAGVYDVSLTIENSTGCIASQTFADMVEVLPSPIAGIKVNSQAATIENPNIDFFEQIIGAYNYLSWDFGDGGSSLVENPSHQFTEPGVFQVVLFAENNFGCTDTAVVQITITTELRIFFPNAFTPNGDGLNDCFEVKGTVYDLINDFGIYIYDRWGSLIYQSNAIDPQCLWDGSIDGSSTKAPLGVYSYRLVGKDFKDKQRSFIGQITIINQQ
jgi:gliding motility-associated-like protein